ncbi:MAG: peptidase BlaR1 [Chitinophagaceae bacterium]|nr:peptidase BlaR1 [Chitinophagaceae bacterium]
MITYIIHAAVYLAGCLAFYKILLQKETFFKLNRFVLLACLVLSFSLPFLPVPQQWSFRKTETPAVFSVQEQIPYFNTATVPTIQQPQPAVITKPQVIKQNSISWTQVTTWLIYLYWFGLAVFGINFLFQVITLFYRAFSRPVIKDGRFRIVEMSGDHAPCSFGNNIFINPEKYDWEIYNQVLLHEKIHIEQGHSFDILLAEIVLIFQWFNPFAWLYRKELENNLEFLTDEEVLQHHVEKSSYQISLLKVSAPHFPLSLTTNYNQSLLKKRLVMMNAKKSNVHTTWKYLFLLPLLVGIACFMNEPFAAGQQVNSETKNKKGERNVNDAEGAWFATIKNDKIQLQFKKDGDNPNSLNGSIFDLSEFKNLPRGEAGNFSLTREAGTMNFTGRFEGNEGMGRYKFVADNSFNEFLVKEGITDIRGDRDMLTFFNVNLKRSYVQMLKNNGYTTLRKNDLIPLAALDINENYIRSIRQNGFSNIALHDLIPFKSLGIDAAYIEDIRKAGYTNVSTNQIISFKAQGIDGKYIADVRSSIQFGNEEKKLQNKEKDKASKETKQLNDNNDKNNYNKNEDRDGNERIREKIKENYSDGLSPDKIMSYKALGINQEYIRSLKEAGYNNLSSRDITGLKALGVDAAYIKSVAAMGYPSMTSNDLQSFKALNITADFIKGFEPLGYTNIPMREVVSLKALHITPEFIKGFNDAGYKDIPLKTVESLKAMNVTPGDIQEYKKLGFENVSVSEVIDAKATGTTPSFITSMKSKGHDLKSIRKYMILKSVID